MTDEKELIALAERVEAWQGRLASLGIGHFRIKSVSAADDIPGRESAKAAVKISAHYDDVQFWFTYEFLDAADERELDETIIHEWLHVSMRDLDSVVNVVEAWMPEATHSDFSEMFHHEREGVIDRVARTLYSLHCKSQ